MNLKNAICRLTALDSFSDYKDLFPIMDETFMFRFALAMQTLHRVTVLTENYFAKHGLSKARFVIMVHLLIADKEKGESISDLIPHYCITSAAMTGIVDTLEKSNMVERIANPDDRRRVNIRLTDTGRKFMMEFLPKHQANAKEMSKYLSDKEQDLLGLTLGKLVKGMEEYLEK